MRLTSIVLVCALVCVVGIGTPSPGKADVFGVVTGNVIAVYPNFNGEGGCRIKVAWIHGFSTVDFIGNLGGLCNPYDVYYGAYIAVPVTDQPVVCVDEVLSRFVATGIPLNVAVAHY